MQQQSRETAVSVISHSAEQWPDSTAVETDGTTVTYADLVTRIADTRSALALLGVQKGDHVATLMGPGPAWVTVFYATMSLGAVVVPLNLTWSGPEVAQALRLTDAKFVITESHFRGQDLIKTLETALPGLVGSSSPLALTELPTLQAVAVLRSEGFGGELPVHAPELVPGTDPVAPYALDPEDIALLLLTSGSTSFPKPAMVSHRALVSGWTTYAEALEISSASVYLNYAPNYHVGGIAVMGMAMLRGARTLMMRWFEPEEAMRLIDAESVTHVWGFDTHFSMMRDAPSYGKFNLTSAKHTISASNVGAEGVKAFLGMGFTHHGSVYGSTEYMGLQSFFPPADMADVDRMMRSNGRATSGELRIVDVDTHEVLDPLVSGEICVRGPALFSGYYNLPEETAKCMDAEGFFHSGDRGYLDEDGYLFFQGRYKEMIKSGGENVSMAEVEQFLLSHVAGIRHVAVCGVPDSRWGEAVTAAVVPEDGTTAVTETLIKSACKGNLASYKIPKSVVFLSEDEWLATPTGKMDRQGLRNTTLSKLGITN